MLGYAEVLESLSRGPGESYVTEYYHHCYHVAVCVTVCCCSPTPRVVWRRIDSPMPSKNYNSSFGQELVIPDVEFSDKGRYRCAATNSVSGSEVSRDFTLTVECKFLVAYIAQLAQWLSVAFLCSSNAHKL